jgi:spore coat protein CotH
MNMRRLLLGLLLVAGCGGDGDEGSSSSPSSPGPSIDPFEDSVLATYEITMAPGDWEAMVANLEDNTWRRATIVWRGETWPDVAIHPAGQSSRDPDFANPSKPSMWLSFNEFVPGREFHKYERVKLDGMVDDPALMRERIVYPIYAARGVAAPRVAHCRVVVNGVYRGLYMVEERINKEFVTKRFGRTLVNQLYRWTEFEPDLRWVGPDPARYVPNMWEPRIETLGPGAEAMRDFIDLLNHTPGSVGDVFDIDVFLNWMAVEVASGETDGYIGWSPGATGFYTGNIFLYRNPANNKYTMIVWDRDQSFWREEGITFGFDQRILTNQLIVNNPTAMDRYKSFLRSTVDGPAHPAVLEARLDSIRSQIEAAAFEDPYKTAPTNQHLIWEWEDLRRYFAERRNLILQQLGS